MGSSCAVRRILGEFYGLAFFAFELEMMLVHLVEEIFVVEGGVTPRFQ